MILREEGHSLSVCVRRYHYYVRENSALYKISVYNRDILLLHCVGRPLWPPLVNCRVHSLVGGLGFAACNNKIKQVPCYLFPWHPGVMLLDNSRIECRSPPLKTKEMKSRINT